MKFLSFLLITAGLVAFGLFIMPSKASAHCDTLNGPVVGAGQRALDTGNLSYASIWVQKKDEDELKKAFETALNDRKKNKATADRAFFEALVKIHREGEGATYTGLKEAGDLDPAIAAADKAVEAKDLHLVLEILPEQYHAHVTELFKNMQTASNYEVNDVEAGREYVEKYVEFVHVVEAAAEGKDLGTHHDSHAAESAAKPQQSSTTSSIVNLPVIAGGVALFGLTLLAKKFFS